jgi:hypothetical protein
MHAKLTFMLTAGGTAFVAGDTFLINTASPWVGQRSVAGDEMIWMAKGNDDQRQIYVGAKLFADVGADYYNWRLQGMTGFSSGNTFVNQPGQIAATNNPIVTLWNAAIPYWFVANGQSVKVVAKVGGIYACCYLGLYNSYLSPGQNPYPLLIGGNMAWTTEPGASSVSWRYSYTGDAMHAYWRGYPNSAGNDMRNMAGRFRGPAGTYLGLEGFQAGSVLGLGRGASVWPFACEGTSGTSGGGFNDIRENLDGSYPLLPIFFASDDASTSGTSVNSWGELDGVRATTGHVNASENTIQDGLLRYVVFQDTYRTLKDCYCALALD